MITNDNNTVINEDYYELNIRNLYYGYNGGQEFTLCNNKWYILKLYVFEYIEWIFFKLYSFIYIIFIKTI